MRAYLCGDLANHFGFIVSTKNLVAMGYDVVSPYLVPFVGMGTLRDHVEEHVERIMGCDLVIVLPGWQDNPGALAEVELAQNLGIEVIDLYEALHATA